ncbi:class I SAM-dependent methyltransferase [Paraoerskovia sediminicola]|uniref:class I SAM-dependent methyltransferase n=1 Tax=Paraoerskovia sediminicola TaxID=1138587 RepID=UPI0025744869|nr:methyltransferase [Paraoerskovia sediminicola]
MSDTPDHYFTASPASVDERRTLSVDLAGRTVDVEVASGVFSPGRLDLGTRVLLRSVPELPQSLTGTPAPAPTDRTAPAAAAAGEETIGSDPAAGGQNFLDLGCGWGPVALTMALERPTATVWAVDVNERSLDLTRRNAASLGATGVRAVRPDDVPDDVRFDAIWSNPPIRVGKEALHAMLELWLPRLAPDGVAHLVVQRNLGADSLARWMDEHLDGLASSRSASAKGFRVLEVRHR